MAAGIAVVLVDRGVPATVPHTSFVSTDDGVIGRLTALWLAETLGGQGAVLMLPGHAEAEPAQTAAGGGAGRCSRAFPALQSAGVEWTGWQPGDGAADRAASSWRSRGRRLPGSGAIAGCRAWDRCRPSSRAACRAGAFRRIPGGDLNLAYKLAIRHGVELAAVDYPPAMGLRAMEVLHAALRGEWVPSAGRCRLGSHPDQGGGDAFGAAGPLGARIMCAGICPMI